MGVDQVPRQLAIGTLHLAWKAKGWDGLRMHAVRRMVLALLRDLRHLPVRSMEQAGPVVDEKPPDRSPRLAVGEQLAARAQATTQR